ncbi:hypothetical protein BWK63_11985 [Flavobacterium covae]|uniref:hypothetical protein n=1 Tax=Flavobacterium TaxID=237 RepID=UPI000B4C60F1|nr:MULTISPECIES: hypothetical protein [Flavobacterium]OWP80254.1 hypothetical protein BWK63_11985 [Flavobacterium covae]OWP87522.1 hypothetical protein BWK60_03370 [Flavobacterium covae]POR20912.1 hypothetical protein BWK57_11960 [Flavobacterium columnare]
MTPEEFRKRFQDLASQYGPAVSNIAKVKAIDKENWICTLEDEDGQEIPAVRLRPVQSSNKSILLLPSIGSYVLAVRIEDDEDWLVIACDKLEKVGIYVEETLLEIDKEGFLLKKENESLKAILSDLVSYIKAMSFTVSTTGTATAQSGATQILNNSADFETIETRLKTLLK